jgi:hypothetical protein
MPRYLVERSFPQGLAIPIDEGGAKTCQLVVDGNAAEGVTWVHSYVTPDKQTTFCIYDGPSPQARDRCGAWRHCSQGVDGDAADSTPRPAGARGGGRPSQSRVGPQQSADRSSSCGGGAGRLQP